MRFEKINENKIKIIVNITELITQNVDFHSFMSNPLSSQDFFNTLLENAEKQIGFNTKDYNIKIEVISLSNIDFIITLTKLNNNSSNPNIHTFKKRKIQFPNYKNNLIYCFNTFNDFYDFINFITKIDFNIKSIKNSLYFYNNNFFLIIEYLNINTVENNKIDSIITDFATVVENPDIFYNILCEYGKVIINNNSISTINKYFNSKHKIFK